MGTPLLIKQAPMNSVAAGSTATLALPKGLTYAQLILSVTNAAAAASRATFASIINEIRVIVDNKVKRRLSGSELNNINAYRGYDTNLPNGGFVIAFERPEMRTQEQETLLGLGTMDVANISIEIDIDASATSPAIDVYAVHTDPSLLGAHTVIDKKTYNFSGAGEHEITDIPKQGVESPFKAISAFHLIGSNITRVEVIRNSQVIYDATDLINETLVEMGRAGIAKTKQSNTHHVDFGVRDRLGDHLVLTTDNVDGKGHISVQDFRIRVTTSGASTPTLLIEAIEKRPGRA